MPAWYRFVPGFLHFVRRFRAIRRLALAARRSPGDDASRDRGGNHSASRPQYE